MSEMQDCTTCKHNNTVAWGNKPCTGGDCQTGPSAFAMWEPVDSDARIDVIGQNGNDGLHYEQPASSTQVGGSHYTDMAIQPFTYIHANGLGFAEGCVVKYVSRWRAKNGIEDLRKARHFIDMLIDAEIQSHKGL